MILQSEASGKLLATILVDSSASPNPRATKTRDSVHRAINNRDSHEVISMVSAITKTQGRATTRDSISTKVNINSNPMKRNRPDSISVRPLTKIQKVTHTLSTTAVLQAKNISSIRVNNNSSERQKISNARLRSSIEMEATVAIRKALPVTIHSVNFRGTWKGCISDSRQKPISSEGSNLHTMRLVDTQLTTIMKGGVEKAAKILLTHHLRIGTRTRSMIPSVK